MQILRAAAAYISYSRQEVTKGALCLAGSLLAGKITDFAVTTLYRTYRVNTPFLGLNKRLAIVAGFSIITTLKLITYLWGKPCSSCSEIPEERKEEPVTPKHLDSSKKEPVQSDEPSKQHPDPQALMAMIDHCLSNDSEALKVKIHQCLSQAQEARGKKEYAQELAFLEEALSIAKTLPNQKDPLIVVVYNCLAASLVFKKGSAQQILTYSQMGLTLAQEVCPQNDPVLLMAYSNVGTSLAGLNRYEEALPVLEKASRIALLFFGRDHVSLPIIYNTISISLDNLNKQVEALCYLEKIGFIQRYQDWVKRRESSITTIKSLLTQKSYNTAFLAIEQLDQQPGQPIPEILGFKLQFCRVHTNKAITNKIPAFIASAEKLLGNQDPLFLTPTEEVYLRVALVETYLTQKKYKEALTHALRLTQSTSIFKGDFLTSKPLDGEEISAKLLGHYYSMQAYKELNPLLATKAAHAIMAYENKPDGITLDAQKHLDAQKKPA